MKKKANTALLVLELQRATDSGTVTVVASIPGREGTLTREWKALPGHSLSPAAAQDVVAWVSLTTDTWLLSGGVQQQLFAG